MQAIRIWAVHSRHLRTQSVRVRLWRSGICSPTCKVVNALDWTLTGKDCSTQLWPRPRILRMESHHGKRCHASSKGWLRPTGQSTARKNANRNRDPKTGTRAREKKKYRFGSPVLYGVGAMLVLLEDTGRQSEGREKRSRVAARRF